MTKSKFKEYFTALSKLNRQTKETITRLEFKHSRNSALTR